MHTENFSCVFQVTQECPFLCEICLRDYEPGRRLLSWDERKQMVDTLWVHGVKRLTITGGEPMLLAPALFDFLRYIHQREIHICLSTTGYKLTQSQVEKLDGFVDELMLSVRSLTKTGWIQDFGNTPYTLELFENVCNILQWVKTTGLIVEVYTAVHRENLHRIVRLGWQLFSLNPNIIWRVTEYCGIGLRADLNTRFEITEAEFIQVQQQVIATFGHLFRSIRFDTKQDRLASPGFIITQSGDLLTKANETTRYNVITGPLPDDFSTRRPWSKYRNQCRDWGWEDL